MSTGGDDLTDRVDELERQVEELRSLLLERLARIEEELEEIS